MDLQQRKLTKSEWDSIEKSIPEKEVEILNLITSGYADVNIRYNNNQTLLSFLKIEWSESWRLPFPNTIQINLLT